MPSKDIEKRREANRRHYAKHTERVKAANNIYKKSARQKWAEYKATLSCVECGENHPATLDFHHFIRSKDNVKVYRLTANGAYKKALEEIKKCVVLCSNCHRKHHYLEKRGRSPLNYTSSDSSSDS
jgi:hypothetical protein